MTQRRQKRATLSDVARLAGVSQPVASLVMAGKTSKHVRYSQETAARVRAAAEKLNYRRNRTVASFQKGTHGSIGILVRQANYMLSNLLAGIMRAARDHDQFVLVEQLGGDSDMPRLVAEDCVDGLIVFEDVPDMILDEAERFRMPLVQVNTNRRGPGSITFDESGAMTQAVRVFAQRQRRCPALIVGGQDPGHYSVRARFDALTAASATAGMSVPEFFDCGDLAPPHVQRIRAFLEAHQGLDALVLYMDLLAPGVYDAVAALGKRIASDLSVIGFNDGLTSKAVRPPLSALRLDPSVVATAAVGTLNELIDGRVAPPGPLVLPYAFKDRRST